MKTRNYNLNLMIPMQTDKEILFNESISTIDNFCNSTILSFIDAAPSLVVPGDKYIISSGDNRNHICYSNHINQEWQFLKPQKNMILFVEQTNSFYVFDNNNWQPKTNDTSPTTSTANNSTSNHNYVTEQEKFTGISGTYEIPVNSSFLYLYLNEDCQIDFTRLKLREITIILKQHYQRTNTIQWPTNILWMNNAPHQIINVPNSMDIVKFYRLIETGHYLGKIIGQNYKF